MNVILFIYHLKEGFLLKKKAVSSITSAAMIGSLVLMNVHPASAEEQSVPVDLAEHGMVSSSHDLATQIGQQFLSEGANAVDAAVAVQFALNVVEPHMSGIGGGGFMMVYDSNTGETTIVNSRERAPLGATPDMFLDEDGNVIPFAERSTSGPAVGVPGTLDGVNAALGEWGSFELEELIQPAIDLAADGFHIDRQLADAISDNQTKLLNSKAKHVYLPDGEPLEQGDFIIQDDLAHSLNLIQEHGLDVFYHGEIGDAIAETVQTYGGTMTKDDIARFNSTIEQPVWGEYHDYSIASMPPPSSGGLTLLQMLSILDGFDIGKYDPRDPMRYHILAETMRLAYADRAEYMGDPEFVEVPFDGLLHPEYIEQRRDLIPLDRSSENVEAGDPWAFDERKEDSLVSQYEDQDGMGETTHFTVTDADGNMVSYTSTIESLFGTGIMVPDYGIMLNNELTDFDAVPGGANEVQPNKRPLSSMTPTIVFDGNGEPVMSVGSPGGPRIINAVFQVITNVLDHGMTLEEAVDEPRIHSMGAKDITYEDTIPTSAIRTLEEMGHEFNTQMEIGNVQSIRVTSEGLYEGVADKRRDGASLGLTVDATSMRSLVRELEANEEIESADVADELYRDLSVIRLFQLHGFTREIVSHTEAFQDTIDALYEEGELSFKVHRMLHAQASIIIHYA
ncbi:gamma-glutamyltransferase [Geomicrobium sediminis]|uniref:gamma-glutamyltransferase n=1 Tax=Geomicrobium sediminis TaxID=1347788 RepID=UPI003B83A0F4